jgi:hypothetical protein
MRYLYLLISIFLFLNITNLYCQEDDDPGYLDLSSTVDWADPIYSSFFDGSCVNSSKSGRVITEYKQCNTAWYINNYGVNCQSSSERKTTSCVFAAKSNDAQCYIGDKGCALTCMAMILASCGISADPGTLQTFMHDLPLLYFQDVAYTGML